MLFPTQYEYQGNRTLIVSKPLEFPDVISVPLRLSYQVPVYSKYGITIEQEMDRELKFSPIVELIKDKWYTPIGWILNADFYFNVKEKGWKYHYDGTRNSYWTDKKGNIINVKKLCKEKLIEKLIPILEETKAEEKLEKLERQPSFRGYSVRTSSHKTNSKKCAQYLKVDVRSMF